MRVLLTVVAFGLLAIVALLGLFWLFQRSLIYIPLGGAPPSVRSLFPGAEDVILETDDGLRLGGWFFPSVDASPGPAVIVFNGNAGNRGSRMELAHGFVQAGFAVLLFDYRGYGGNPGSPSAEGLLLDAQAARNFVSSREDVDSSRVVYFGESLGAAVAVALSSEDPPASLVLRSPFSSLADVARLHYPLLPAGWLLRDRYPSIDRISALRCPLMVIAGEADRIIPIEQSRALFEAASTQSKKFVSVPGADHNDLELAASPGVLHDVADFLAEQGVIGGSL